MGGALCSICGSKYMGFAVLRVFRSPTPDIPNVYLDDAPFIPHFKREDFSEDDYGHWLHYHWFSFGFFPMVMMRHNLKKIKLHEQLSGIGDMPLQIALIWQLFYS